MGENFYFVILSEAKKLYIVFGRKSEPAEATRILAQAYARGGSGLPA